jgi:hypothetical protein
MVSGDSDADGLGIQLTLYEDACGWTVPGHRTSTTYYMSYDRSNHEQKERITSMI